MDYFLVEKMSSKEDTSLKDIVYMYIIYPSVFYI